MWVRGGKAKDRFKFSRGRGKVRVRVHITFASGRFSGGRLSARFKMSKRSKSQSTINIGKVRKGLNSAQGPRLERASLQGNGLSLPKPPKSLQRRYRPNLCEGVHDIKPILTILKRRKKK